MFPGMLDILTTLSAIPTKDSHYNLNLCLQQPHHRHVTFPCCPQILSIPALTIRTIRVTVGDVDWNM